MTDGGAALVTDAVAHPVRPRNLVRSRFVSLRLELRDPDAHARAARRRGRGERRRAGDRPLLPRRRRPLARPLHAVHAVRRAHPPRRLARRFAVARLLPLSGDGPAGERDRDPAWGRDGDRRDRHGHGLPRPLGGLAAARGGPLGMIEFGFLPVLQRVDLVGLAVFIVFAGAGRWSADHELGRTADPSLEAAGQAVWALKVCAGVALIVVAFAEKLAMPGMALDFLAHHQQFNVAQQVGLDWSDLEFTRVAGAIEVLFGLLVISGALSQACVLIAGIPFNATLWFFGTTELVGHLPVYGAMLVLLVYGSDPALRPAVSSLWPFGRRPLERLRATLAAGPA